MNQSVLYNTDSRLLALLVFISILIFYFGGLKLSQWMQQKNPSRENHGMGPFEGAMLGLLSLLLAFTFNKSASYYDHRRELLVHETNCIGTVILRTDLFSDSVRHEFRSDLSTYIASRIRYYEAGDNEATISSELKTANDIAEKIWTRAATISKTELSATRSMQMIPAIGDMIDAISAREEARRATVPQSIMWLLYVLVAAGSFIVGYSGKSKRMDWIIVLSYSLMTVLTIYLILDLDHPRNGLINTSATHENMYGLQEMLNHQNDNH